MICLDSNSPIAVNILIGLALDDEPRGTAVTVVAARPFAAQLPLPLTLDMRELNGNEKHADLPKPLPANASLPGTIRHGDLMLYGADTLFQGLSRWTGWNMSLQAVQRTARRKLA